MFETLRTARAVLRSLRVYYGHRARHSAMDDLYRQFVHAGDLVFDVGAHVGDRVGTFRRLGTKVVAVEPQPALALTLGAIYGRDKSVVIERKAVGRSSGEITLKVNIDNPTVTTASDAFVKAADGAAGPDAAATGEPTEPADPAVEPSGEPTPEPTATPTRPMQPWRARPSGCWPAPSARPSPCSASPVSAPTN